ncbi:MAG: serine/threonine-protein kinase [Planctomycetota bacterium]|nr:serine/threonine-protein kinase [Planctomycetota bacterium]
MKRIEARNMAKEMSQPGEGAPPRPGSGTGGVGCPGAAVLEMVASSGSDDAVLVAHISSCDGCRGVVEEIRENNRFLGEFEAELRPAELFEEPGLPADLMPGYTIGGEIHRGAQGVVYRGVQERTRREVAIKMLLQGAFATSRQRARFEREAEIAAQLRHPNIVTVYDSMSVRGGRFALVMEYISGQEVDQWAASLSGLAPGVRINRIVELFLQIVDAVHYAHQRGVIHRDLKPANILVDAEGRPRVLDFGIAKLHGPSGDGPAVPGSSGVGSGGGVIDAVARARAQTAVTRAGEFAGTLAYASPEQLSGQPELIDTRTDVYALGVILYELLTGRMPYDVTGSFAQVIDQVVNEPPVPLRKVLAGADEDLATILDRCLAKEVVRRYESAGALLADLRHYLAGEAIDARRTSSWYLVRKWAARRKALVAALIGVAAVVVVSGVVGTYARNQRAERERAERDNFRVTKAKEFADRSREGEKKQREVAEASKTFMGQILAAVAPGAARGREVSRTYMLDQAEAQLKSGALSGQPGVEIEVRMLLGRNYGELGMHEKAAMHLRRAAELCDQSWGQEHLVTAQVAESLGRALGLQGGRHVEEAVKQLQLSLTIRRQLAGEGSGEVASSLNALGLVLVHNARFEDALRPLREALAIRRVRLAGDDPDLLETLMTLAQATWQADSQDSARAGELFDECLAAGKGAALPDHPVMADAMYQCAHMLTASGDYAKAHALAQQALVMRRRLFGDVSAAVAQCLDLVAGLDAVDGRMREAEPLLVEAAQTYEKVFGKSSEPRLMTLANLGRIYYRMGNYAKSEPVLLEWHAGLVASGDEGEMLAHARDCLRQLYEDWDRPSDAARWR